MTEAQPLGPTHPYSVTKLAAEQLALMLGEQFGVEVLALRFAPSYGYTYSAASSVYGSVIEALVKGAAEGRAVGVERAEAFRSLNEFAYVRDLAAAIVCALEATAPRDRVFNVGSGELVDLADFVAVLQAEVPAARISLTEPNGGLRDDPTRFPYDLSRARDQLGYVPRYPLATGLRDYLATIDALRKESMTLEAR
jgi:nucleoside-diphosphate-sugar epimerase